MGRASASSALVVSEVRRGGSEEFGAASRIPDYLGTGVLPMSADHLCRRCGSALLLAASGDRRCPRCAPSEVGEGQAEGTAPTRLGRPDTSPVGKEAGETVSGPESAASASQSHTARQEADRALIARLHRLAHLRDRP